MTENPEISDFSLEYEFRRLLPRQVAERLQSMLRLKFTSLEDGIALCLQWLKYRHLSCEVLAKKLMNGTSYRIQEKTEEFGKDVWNRLPAPSNERVKSCEGIINV